jgi:predicted DNA-binding transcriptional regulator AlpA
VLPLDGRGIKLQVRISLQQTAEKVKTIFRRCGVVRSKFKSYDELPLFLNAKIVAEILGISVAGAYELLHQEDFPVLRIGSRLVVPKEKFLSWIESQTGGNEI